ncbi:hypothetical protein MTO96_009579 [Rhipicephalus appendiculatus]
MSARVCEGKGEELDDAPSGIAISGRLGVRAERRPLLGVSAKPFIFRLRERDAGALSGEAAARPYICVPLR